MLAKPSAAFSVQTVTDASITKKERERGNQENSVLPIIRPVIGYTPHHDPPVMFFFIFYFFIIQSKEIYNAMNVRSSTI